MALGYQFLPLALRRSVLIGSAHIVHLARHVPHRFTLSVHCLLSAIGPPATGSPRLCCRMERVCTGLFAPGARPSPPARR
eukprot:1176365-Alexandrium_andersonii.AAC.1